MFLRREAAPKELLEQAHAAAELARAVARYFREPSEPDSVAVKSRARSAADAARAVKAALKARPDLPGREEWLAASRALAELCDQAAHAVAQAELYEVERQNRTAEMALALRESVEELKLSLGRGSFADHLAAAKRLASTVDALARRARKTSLADVRLVAGLKEQEIFHRLIDAAQAAQSAADSVAEVLSVR